MPTHTSSKQQDSVFYIGATLFCILIVSIVIQGIRSQKVDEHAQVAVRNWLIRQNPGRTIELTRFEYKPGFKGKNVMVEYTVDGNPAPKSPRYLLIRRGLTGPWEVAYEIKQSDY